MTSVYADHEASMEWQRDPARTRLGRAGVARRARRLRLEPDAALHLQPGVPAGGRSVAVADGHPDGGARDHHVRHGRAEGLLPAPHPDRRGVLLPGLLRTGGRLGPGVAVDGGGRRRRRPGVHRQQDLDDPRRARRTGCSRWCARHDGAEEAAGHHVRPDRHGHAGHPDPPAGDDLRRGGPEPGLLRRGPGAQVQCARQDRRRLDRREVPARVRARRRRHRRPRCR